jgi:hypothetical protein
VVSQGGGDVDNVAAAPLEHLGDGPFGQPEEATEVDPDSDREVVGCVVGERLRDEDAGVVDEGVDAPEAFKCPTDDPVGGGGIGDVSFDAEHARVPSWLERARSGDNRPAPPPILCDKAGADALRTPSDNRDLPVLMAHDLTLRQPLVRNGSLGCGSSGVVCTLSQ